MKDDSSRNPAMPCATSRELTVGKQRAINPAATTSQRMQRAAIPPGLFFCRILDAGLVPPVVMALKQRDYPRQTESRDDCHQVGPNHVRYLDVVRDKERCALFDVVLPLRHQRCGQRGDTSQCQQSILRVAAASVDEEQRGESQKRGDEDAVRGGVEVFAEGSLPAMFVCRLARICALDEDRCQEQDRRHAQANTQVAVYGKRIGHHRRIGHLRVALIGYESWLAHAQTPLPPSRLTSVISAN